MKKIIPCLIGGIVLGAGGMLGVTQIPSVNSALMKDSNSSFEDISLEAENSDLKLNNSILKEDVDRLNSELSECNSLIKQKDETIASQVTRINDLNTQISSLLSELDNYKNSPGDGSDNSDIISNLQSQLDLKTSELNTATAELEQLRVDKTSLETRVQELETELDVVLEELKKFKDNENIDALNVSSYNGTWYLNGTFERVITIKDGVVTLNSNEDSGVVGRLYNQMYLFMSTNSLAVNLSLDGNSFETANGEVYKRFYTNTTETVLSNYAFAGKYSNSDETIELKVDNTLVYTLGEDVYYGAYTVVSHKRNVGGNVVINETISANIQINGDTVSKEFTYSSADSLVIVSNNVNYSKISNLVGSVLSAKSFSMPDSYYKVVVKTDEFVTIDSNSSLMVWFSRLNTSNSCCKVNGETVTALNCTLYNTSTEVIRNNIFEFYIVPTSNWNSAKLTDISSIGSVYCDIVSVENVGVDESIYPLYGELLDVYGLTSCNFSCFVDCGVITDYINGTYSNGALSISLEDGVSAITYSGSEAIIASNVDISAKTDGYDIYQDVVITYSRLEMVGDVEKEVAHTITLTFKNDSLTSSLLDNELLEL